MLLLVIDLWVYEVAFDFDPSFIAQTDGDKLFEVLVLVLKVRDLEWLSLDAVSIELFIVHHFAGVLPV